MAEEEIKQVRDQSMSTAKEATFEQQAITMFWFLGQMIFRVTWLSCNTLPSSQDLHFFMKIGRPPTRVVAHIPEGTKRATSVNMHLLRLQKGLRTGSILRDVSFPSGRCSRRSGMFTEVALLVPPGHLGGG